MAICASASRREQMPELAMYLFNLISSGLPDFLGGGLFFLTGDFPRA